MKHNCPECKRPRLYTHRYDAFYCDDCDVWLEPKCSDKACAYCAGRPEQPEGKE